MSRLRFPRSRFVGVLTLAIVMVITMTMMTSVQGPDNGEFTTAAIPGGHTGASGPVKLVEELELGPGAPAAPDASYFKFYAASSFVPYDDDMTYAYYGAGCVYHTGGTIFSEQSLQLPQGAVADYIRIYFYDTDATHDATAFLFAFDGAGNYTQVAAASSSGTPGQNSAGSGFFSYPVDNVDSALSLRLSYGNATTSSLRICGVRIRYQYSIATLRLPLILKAAQP